MIADLHREMAEKYLGRKIDDKDWTPEARAFWKRFFFSKLYGAEGTFHYGSNGPFQKYLSK